MNKKQYKIKRSWDRWLKTVTFMRYQQAKIVGGCQIRIPSVSEVLPPKFERKVGIHPEW